MMILRVLFIGLAVGLLTDGHVAFADDSVLTTAGQKIMDAHVSVDSKLATLYSGACKVLPGVVAADEPRLEDRYFPFAAHKLIEFNNCDETVLARVAGEGYQGRFAKLVVKDIASKLPTLRPLNSLALKLKSELDELNKENFSNEAQLARFGYLDQSQIAEQARRGTRITKLEKDLKVTLAAEAALIATIWRSTDREMKRYLNTVINSSLPINSYVAAALKPDPPAVYRILSRSFSFVDRVITPMIAESKKTVATLEADYVTENGRRVFRPGFATRALLVNNMDLVVDTDDGPPAIKDLQCHLDYKYAKGDDDFGTTVSVLTMLSGPLLKGVSFLLKSAELLDVFEGSLITQRLVKTYAGAAGSYGFLMTAQSAVSACRGTGATALSYSKSICTATTDPAALGVLEDRELDSENCGLMFVSTILTETGASAIGKRISGFFSSNHQLVSQIHSVQEKSIKALKIKDQEQVVQSNVETTRDAEQIIVPPKDDDASSTDDSKDDSKTDNGSAKGPAPAPKGPAPAPTQQPAHSVPAT